MVKILITKSYNFRGNGVFGRSDGEVSYLNDNGEDILFESAKEAAERIMDEIRNVKSQDPPVKVGEKRISLIDGEIYYYIKVKHAEYTYRIIKIEDDL